MKAEISNRIDAMLEDHFRKPWMDDNDFTQTIQLMFDVTGTTKDDLINAVAEGVSNGYSIDEQFEIMRNLFKV